MMENKCNGFCPECGWDLDSYNLTCQCKNPECDWSCSDCANATAENSKNV